MKKDDIRWQEIEYFNPETDKMLSCSCCGQCNIRYDIIKSLDRFRERINIPIIVTSGYRCPEHNKSVGGVDEYGERGNHKMSYHVHGLAVDWTIHTKSLLHIAYKLAISSELFKGVGLSLQKGFIHADIGSTFERFWIYNFSGGTRLVSGDTITEIENKGTEYYLKQLGSENPEKMSKWD